MKLKSTWIVIGVFAALGAYLYFVEEPSHRARQKAKEEEGLLFPKLDPDKVTEISIEGARGKVRAKKGEGGRWRLLEPMEDRADEGRLRSLLADLKSLKAGREIEGPNPDLKAFGLAEPEVLLKTEGAPVALAVGSENPAGDSRYVRSGSGPVKLAKNDAVLGLLLDAKDLRDKQLLGSFAWTRLQALEVRPESGKPLRLVKKGETWRLEEPFAAEADPDAVSALAEKIRWARIESFLGEDPAQAEEALARGVVVTLRAEGEPSPATVRMAQVGNEVWASAGDRKALFTLRKDLLDAFRADPQDLRRLRPVLTKTWSAERIEISGLGKKLEYRRSEGAWRMEGRAIGGAEGSALQDYLSVLEAAKATDVIDSPGEASLYGLAAPKISMKILDSQHKEQSLAVGEARGKVFARSGDSGPVYTLGAEYLAKAVALIKAGEMPQKAVSAAGKP